MIPTVEWKNGAVCLLDQSLLPGEVKVLECRDYHTVADAIRDLRVRGAPAIGVTAAMGVALGAQQSGATTFAEFETQVLAICDTLAATRPTAVNLFWAIQRMKEILYAHQHLSIKDLQARLVQESLAIQHEDIEMNRAIGRYGSTLISHGQQILTHCNAGAPRTRRSRMASATVW